LCYHRPVSVTANSTVAFRTVGCRLNQCDTAQMQDALHVAGFRVVDWEERADVRVVNTCTVTARSDRTCRHEIHSAKRLDPRCLLAVTGCLAQVAPEKVATIPGVDLVVGNPDKHRLAEHLMASFARRPGDSAEPAPGATSAAHAAGTAPPVPKATAAFAVSAPVTALEPQSESFCRFPGRTRAFLKVQTGCDSACAYCIVPLARGPACSLPQASVLQQVRRLEADGYREVVLTGIDLGSWGRDRQEGSLADLLGMLLRDGPSSVRYRLSSLEPLELDDALLGRFESSEDRLARHFHLPLQSGSDAVLARMGRPYTSAQYLDVVRGLTRRLPHTALGADVIVGFPGETEAEFEETLALVEASPLTYLHVFGYSDRPGTRAAAMEAKVRPEVIRERSERLRGLGACKRAAFGAAMAGSEQTVLVLAGQAADGRLIGLTGNYLRVLVDGRRTSANQLVRMRLDRPSAGGLWEATLLERRG
jgi:threonylcarbamoyladenosine tRNA methylthiotransferase MtaB